MEFLFAYFAGLSPATIFLFVMLIIFVIVFARESTNPNSNLRWTDMLLETRGGSKKLSLSRLGQFIGIFISTWIVVTVVNMTGTISSELLGIYLAYLLGGYGFNKYINKREEKREEKKEENDLVI